MLSCTKCCLLVIVFLTAVVTISVIVGITDSVHTIDEGNVGIYYVQVGARSGTIIFIVCDNYLPPSFLS